MGNPTKQGGRLWPCWLQTQQYPGCKSSNASWCILHENLWVVFDHLAASHWNDTSHWNDEFACTKLPPSAASKRKYTC